MPEVLTTLLSVPAILAVVTFLRDQGLPSRRAPIAAVILGVGIALAEFTVSTPQPWEPRAIYLAVAGGLVLGLSASGIYDTAKLVRPSPSIAVVPLEASAEPVAPGGYVPEHSVQNVPLDPVLEEDEITSTS